MINKIIIFLILLINFFYNVDKSNAYDKFYDSNCSNIKIPLSFKYDDDSDGIADSCEQILGEKYAPIIYHAIDEPNLPTNVDEFLNHTSLAIYDDECDFIPDMMGDIHILVKNKPSQNELISNKFNDNYCGSTGLVNSNCTRSIKKQRTYYLNDVDDNFKKGSTDSRFWTTYFHSYKNDLNGITIQYWRFYAFNTGYRLWIFDFSHGGDWECVQVKLDHNLNPVLVHLLGHTEIDDIDWEKLLVENNHPKIFSEKGGHSSIAFNNQIGIRQETWSGGKVNWSDGRITESGQLVNMGEKLRPMNNQVFIQFSGLWGSPGDAFWTSGYWSPPYNETEIDKNTQFVKAWCNGISITNIENNEMEECKPCGTSR